MRCVRFTNGVDYTFAAEIENFAVKFGYIPRVDPDGSRHPGRECNQYLRKALQDPAVIKTFQMEGRDYIQVDKNITHNNGKFIQLLLDRGYITPQTLKNGKLDLYSLKAATIIIRMMLGRYCFEIPPQCIQYIENGAVFDHVIYTTKRLDKYANRYTTHKKLFISYRSPGYKVIEQFTPEEQEIIRRYNRLVKETRAMGRPHKPKTGGRVKNEITI